MRTAPRQLVSYMAATALVGVGDRRPAEAPRVVDQQPAGTDGAALVVIGGDERREPLDRAGVDSVQVMGQRPRSRRPVPRCGRPAGADQHPPAVAEQARAAARNGEQPTPVTTAMPASALQLTPGQ